MTPVERYMHLTVFWRNQRDELRKDMNEAQRQYEHWNNKLVAAEIAEKLANEKS